MKRVLVLSVSAGAGHIRAAQAICAAPVDCPVEAIHLDAMEFVPKLFRHIYTKTYLRLVGSYPKVWDWLYGYTNKMPRDSRLQYFRRSIERRVTQSLMRKINLLKPDAIVCTHFLPAEMLGYRKPEWRLSCPVWVQITDFTLHRMWIQPGVTGYFVGNDETAFQLREEGVDPVKIKVTGLPIMPSFLSMPARAVSAASIGLDESKFTLLLMGGGEGVGNLAELAIRFLAIDSNLQLIVMTGKNQKLSEHLAVLAASCAHRFVVQGYMTEVHRFMACADVIVTKSGGLTSAECLAAGLPMIINSSIPGQEEGNANFLVEHGVAMNAMAADNVEYRVRILASSSDQRKKMAISARALARPDAASKVMQAVLSELNQTMKNDC